MKKILLLFIILNGFTGCIKIQDESFCNQSAPATPVLTQTTVNESYSGYYYSFTNSISSPNSAYVYTWTSPIGNKYYGSTLSYDNDLSPTGTWSVVAGKGSCYSNAATFTVGYNVAPCAGVDTLVLDGYSNYKLNFTGVVNQGTYQQYTFIDPNNSYNVLHIDFYGVPSAGNYNLTSENPSYLSQGYCYIYFSTNSDSYYSNSGYVNVSVAGSILTFSFCSAGFTDSYYSDNYPISGYFKN